MLRVRYGVGPSKHVEIVCCVGESVTSRVDIVV